MGEAETFNKCIESTASMVEQLGKSFDELKSHSDQSKTLWQDIKDHFENLERSLMAKFDELEEKEKAFKEKQSKNQLFLVERESAVATKERNMLDRLQKLKNDAVTAIVEARKNFKVDLRGPVDVGGSKEIEVSTVHNSVSENLPDNRSGGSTDAPVEDKGPRPQLKKLCEEMDAKGLLKFISKNHSHHVTLRKELSLALKSAPEPAWLVLDSLEGFYPSDQPTASHGDNNDPVLQALRKNCIVLMESLVLLLGTTDSGVENHVKPEIKQRAKAVADEWMLKLTAVDLDASNGNSSEAQAFLQLILAFGIASDFDEDELCRLVLVVSRRRQTPELCRSLGLAHKMPVVTDALIICGRQFDAVCFAYAFHLTESFPPAPLLKAFLDGLGKSFPDTSTETGTAGLQDDQGQELSALRAIIRWVEENKLQDEYPLAPFQTRVAELKKERIEKGMMMPEPSRFPSKKPRVNYEYTHHRAPGFTIDVRKPSHVLNGRRQRYPYATAPPAYATTPSSAYATTPPVYATTPPVYATASPAYASSSHLVASYGQQANIKRAHNYPEGGMVIGPPAAANYAAPAGYQSAPSNYGSYTGSDFQPSHQPYM